MLYTETIMFSEICEQPRVLAGLENKNKAALEKIAAEFHKRNMKNIATVARGSSKNACEYFKYLTEINSAYPVTMLNPSVYTLYNGALRLENSLVIGVSQSGKAADAIEVMKKAKESGSITVGITNEPDSPMAKEADFHIYLNAEKEVSVAATKTFTAQLMALALITQYITKCEKISAALKEIPQNVQKIIDGAPDIQKVARLLENEKEAFILARGLDYASALESCLKMQETTYTRARAYMASEFHHGPFAVVDDKTVILMLMPKGESYANMKEMLDKCSAQNAKTILYTDSDAKGSLATIAIPSGNGIQTPFYNTVTTQLLVNCLSTLRGLNPDAPRGLNKITITK